MRPKTIVITGGSGGIGSSIAESFADSYSVILHYNSSAEKAKEIESRIRTSGGQVFLIQADLTRENGCRELLESIQKRTDTIDVLVNNAGGIPQRHGIADVTWPLMEGFFALNAFSTIFVTMLLLPLLRNSGNGSIINITSGAIRKGSTTATLYGAAKGAVDVFTRGLAHELAPDVRVNAVAPGVIDTPFHIETSTEQMQRMLSSTPLRRVGSPCHVAHAVRFLVENTFITGETIDVNGGLLMR